MRDQGLAPILPVTNVPWPVVPSPGQIDSALEIAQTIAWRLTDPDLVERAAQQAAEQSAYPRATHWLPYTVAQGYAGLALLCSHLDQCFPGEGWDRIGREHLTRAVRDAECRSHLPLGLFGGLSGIAFAAWQLSCEGTRYSRLLHTLDESLLTRASRAAASLRAARTMDVSQFDLISGLSGVAAYLLLRRSEPRHAECLREILTALVELLSGRTCLPRWHTPPEELHDDRARAAYPFGNLNCGLAHGIPGPLALLSLARASCFYVDGLEGAIAETADWLCQARFDDEWGVNWPTAVPVRQAPDGSHAIGDARAAPDGRSRSAWCYGAPGIARALWLAGEALDWMPYRDLAIAALHAVLKRPIPIRHIDSPSFCHGVAGLLQITLRFRADTRDDAFTGHCRALLRQVINAYQAKSLLGFRHLESGSHAIDQPGLLDGTPAIALTLLATAVPVAPAWDRLFLLS